MKNFSDIQKMQLTASQSGGHDRRKIISSLESLLKQQIQRREVAERKLLEYRHRSSTTSAEFIRLLEKYDNNLASLNGRQVYSQESWIKLVNEIQNFAQRKENMLSQRCNELEKIIERKINQVIGRSQNQLLKNKKLSAEQCRSVRVEVKETLELARKIEEQNHLLRQTNNELLFKNSLLAEERNLLIEQIHQKKTIITKLMQQQSPRKIRAISPQHNKTRSISFQQRIPKYMGEPEFDERPNIEIKESTTRATISHRSHRSNYSNRTPQSVQNENNQSTRQAKTIEHLNIMLDRQKKKKGEFANLFLSLQDKNNEILTDISGELQNLMKITDLLGKNKKLQELIEDVKLRLKTLHSISPPKGL